MCNENEHKINSILHCEGSNMTSTRVCVRYVRVRACLCIDSMSSMTIGDMQPSYIMIDERVCV